MLLKSFRGRDGTRKVEGQKKQVHGPGAMLGAMLGIDHEEYREINGWHIIGTTIKTL